MEITTKLILGDCTQELKKLDDSSIDLIFTSPPYADQRKNTYGGIHPDKYVEWFLPISKELLRVLKFNKKNRFKMFQKAVMVPMGDWAKTRLRHLSETDKIRDESKVGSGFGKNVSNWLGRNKVYPTNVLHMATECNNKDHSAAFPESLPEWFIKLFTEGKDWVLDPFMGSGTTIKVAQRLRRNSIGIEIQPRYYNMVYSEIQPKQYYLLDKKKQRYEINRN